MFFTKLKRQVLELGCRVDILDRERQELLDKIQLLEIENKLNRMGYTIKADIGRGRVKEYTVMYGDVEVYIGDNIAEIYDIVCRSQEINSKINKSRHDSAGFSKESLDKIYEDMKVTDNYSRIDDVIRDYTIVQQQDWAGGSGMAQSEMELKRIIIRHLPK